MNYKFIVSFILSVEEERSLQSLAELHTLRLYVTKEKKKKDKNMFVWKLVTILTGFNFKFVFTFKNEIIYLLRVC